MKVIFYFLPFPTDRTSLTKEANTYTYAKVNYFSLTRNISYKIYFLLTIFVRICIICDSILQEVKH